MLIQDLSVIREYFTIGSKREGREEEVEGGKEERVKREGEL